MTIARTVAEVVVANQPTNPNDGWSQRGNLATLGGQQQTQLTPEMLAMIRQRLGQRV